jgi:hypothetical protein
MSDADDPEKKEKDAEEARLRALVRGAQKRRKEEDAAEETQAAKSEEPERQDKVDDEAETDIVLDDVDLKEALRGALRPPEGAVAPQLLRGVQRKLRVRSKGKFYGDGWSTAESPKTT